jgi:hypothetical protein
MQLTDTSFYWLPILLVKLIRLIPLAGMKLTRRIWLRPARRCLVSFESNNDLFNGDYRGVRGLPTDFSLFIYIFIYS